jgi:FkbM family methyltransferase
MEYFENIIQFFSFLKNENIDHNKELIIFDIGSRDCMHAVKFSQVFPNAKIFSFECNTNTLPICKNNIELYPNITLIDKAVNDFNGVCDFYPIDQEKTITTWKDGNPGASSMFLSNGNYNSIETYVQNKIQVECIRMDKMMKAFNIDHVDIVWMDLQGAELLALKSFGEYLHKIKYIHTEVSYKPIYEGQVLFNELHDFLLSNNFTNINNPNFVGWQEDIIYKNNI